MSDADFGRGGEARWWTAWPRAMLGDWRELRVARRESHESLRAYRDVEAAQPGLAGLERLGAVVARRTGLDAAGVSRVLRHAEESFASWPTERPLRLRDVVQYLVVEECLRADPTRVGTRTRLTTVIAEVIPDNL
ncbi:MAG: hypothetical protein JSR73_06960 [Proteobacteria bacterium]|nr:hypothetical protein [Pseudomonadota bacterium]